MRTYALLAGLACLSLIGCSSLSNCLEEVSTQTNVLSDRIVLIAKTREADGGAATQHHWVIDIDGFSQGTTFFGEKGFDEGATTVYQFPGGIHAETLAKLDQTRFHDMKSSAVLNKDTDRPRVASIEIHYHGRKHVVTQTGAAPIDEGFNQLWQFVAEVQKRSTVLATKATPAPSIPHPTTAAPAPPIAHRAAANLGGPVSGLAPAGPLPTP